MRTIVAFLLAALIAVAQSPADIERQQKQVADHPDQISLRMNLLATLTNRFAGLPPEKVRELRRQHILWLIEHHPDAPNIFEQPQTLLPAKGRLADPAGSAEAAGLWKELARKPDASPALIANAAIYLRAIDPPAALDLLENYQRDPALARARGLVDGAAVLGMSGLGLNVQFGTAAALRDSPDAKAARREIEASSNASLLGGAGVVLLATPGQIEAPFDLALGEDDPLSLSEHWLRRAIEIVPPGTEWKPSLSQTLVNKASRTLDPKEKVRLLTEAVSLVAENAKWFALSSLIVAEFDAGDDAAAEHDAKSLLAGPTNANIYNTAQTVLGRIAAARGDLNEAKSRLTASITTPDSIKNPVFQPNMTLAQDLYDAGQKDAVSQFLEGTRNVWKFDRGRIDRMISFVKKAPSVDLIQLANQFPGNEVIRRPAPAFEAKDLDGKTWTREKLAGKVVALEFGKAPLAEKVSKDFAARGAVLLQVDDEDTKRRFEVLTNPTLVVIDRQGNVAAFHSGAGSEDEWRREFETGFGNTPNPVMLSAPRQSEPAQPVAGKVAVAWEAVDSAESYVVEWDSRDEKGWIFDRDHTVHVIPTRETFTTLDLTGFIRLRWRVFAVPRFGQPGSVSPWREVEGTPVTKIYK
jgi:hypothetical protein